MVDEEKGRSVLTEAQALVYGDRNHDYGHPYEDYTKTAALWSVVLGVPVTAEQAILCMVLVKVSRHLNRSTRDNLVDIGGYAECLNRVVNLCPEEKSRIEEKLGFLGLSPK